MAEQVFLVEDHPIVCRGLATILSTEMGLQVCGEVGTVPEAREQIAEAEPDLVLVDLSLEEGSGLELVRDLRNRWSALPLLVVSMHEEGLYALRSLRAGAQGYVMKGEASETLVDAVRQVLDGRLYVSDEIKERLIQILHGRNALAESPLRSLSDRELQVFERLGHGLKTGEIAEQLHLSPKTVYSYQSRIKEKLGIGSTAKLRQRAAVWMKDSESGDPPA